MGGRPPKSIDQIVKDGNVLHLSNEEIKKRKKAEEALKPPSDAIELPAGYEGNEEVEALFAWYADQLVELDILSNIDADGLARYCVAEILAQRYALELLKNPSPKYKEEVEVAEKISKLHDRYVKQARGFAADLGLTITSRCKLAVQSTKEPPAKTEGEKRFGNRL